MNAPGSIYDSQIAVLGGVYAKLENMFQKTGGRCVVDSAFAKGDYPFLIKALKNYR